MSLSLPFRRCATGLALAFAVACGSDSGSGTVTPTTIAVSSGSGQSADLGQAAAQPLVARVTTSAGTPASGVTVHFAVATGAGTLSPTSVATDASGNASVTFTMGQTPGLTTVAATSGSVSGAAVFYVSTGPTIVGHVTASATNVRFPALSRGPARPPAVLVAPARRPMTGVQLDVAYRVDAVGGARAGALSAMSIDRARTVATTIRARLAAQPVASAFVVTGVSPVIATARVRLRDAALRDSVVRALRADPAVASVSVDGLVSRGPIATHALSRAMLQSARGPRTATTPGAGGLDYPPTQASDIQLWNYSLIDAPRAWHATTGSHSVTVAVIDDGFNFHPDLLANLDAADGYDFVENDSAVVGPQPLCSGGTFSNFDDDGDSGPDPDARMPLSVTFDDADQCWVIEDYANHGLHVAGIIGADGASASSVVTGVDWTVRIRPIRALGIDGSGYYFDIAQAVLYAAGLPAVGANGALVTAPDRAPIINMSLGGPQNDTTLARAVAAAIGAGSLIVAAAGNEPQTAPSYPAALPGVVAVAALGPDAQLASYSSAGPDVSLVAPGGDFRFDDLTNPYTGGTGGILSTTWNFTTGTPSYAFYTGTSMAAPHVSGVAALVLAMNPSMSNDALRTRLLSTAVDLGPVGPDDRYGYGLVDAYAAVTGQQPVTHTFVRAIDAATGVVAGQAPVAGDGSFTLTQLPAGTYYVVAGDDEAGDGVLGFPGRRFGWAGGTLPTTVTIDSSRVADVAVAIGAPIEQPFNDDPQNAQRIFVDSWITGSLASAAKPDVYQVQIPAAGTYTVETSGVLGACGEALELNTTLTLLDPTGATVASNDNSSYFSGGMTFPGLYCSRISHTLQPGLYTVLVGWSSAPAPNPGSYRLQVRTGS